MGKDFSKAGSVKTFAEVAKASAEKANVLTVRMIPDGNLVDFPSNGEDVENTSDLEYSIAKLGFTDPIEVTAFEQPEGQFMIVSGHRRRVAGRKCGISLFPCIVKPFDNAADVHNYALLSNSQRDSAKDPLLFCKRYTMHEFYLKNNGFDGNIRDEIARRLGVSVQQADRYKAMNNVIPSVWEMVRKELVGMSSVLPLATFSVAKQKEIVVIMEECLDLGNALTRSEVKLIVECYKAGMRTYDVDAISWAEAGGAEGEDEEYEEHELRDSGLPLNSYVSTEPGESSSSGSGNRNSEMRREFDPIAANADAMDADKARWDASCEAFEKNFENINSDTQEEQENDTKNLLESEVKLLKTFVDSLRVCITENAFKSDEDAGDALHTLADVVVNVIEIMKSISNKNTVPEVFWEELDKIEKVIQKV